MKLLLVGATILVGVCICVMMGERVIVVRESVLDEYLRHTLPLPLYRGLCVAPAAHRWN